MTTFFRRKPVPREWREDNHWLDLINRRSGHVVGGGATYRSGGACSCGEKFGLDAGNHTMQADDVRDAWLDHVAEAYHGPDYLTITREEA